MKREDFMRSLKYSLRFLPDELYLKLYYTAHLRRKLDLKNPKTFNEKLQWLKFNDRKPFYAIIADKLAVREYIKETIGEEYLIPLIGSWDNFEEIDFNKFPNKFVLKCNHDSGGLVVCTNKDDLDMNKARKVINKSLKTQFYYIGREWQYKNIKPKILCEEFIGEGDIPPSDFKIACFNGKPDNIMVCYGRETGVTKFYFFDTEWNLLRYNGWGVKAPEGFTLPKPENLDEMLRIAEVLSKPYHYARIDLYNVNGKIYFGEITLCPNSGFDGNILKSTDELFGKKLELPTIDY